MIIRIMQENPDGTMELKEERDTSFTYSKELARELFIENVIDKIFLVLRIVGFICQLISIMCFFIVFIK